MSNKKLISQFLGNVLDGNYKKAESTSKAIVEKKLDNRFKTTYKKFLAKKGQ